MNKDYFIVSLSEDGEARIENLTKDELDVQLEEDLGEDDNGLGKYQPNIIDMEYDGGKAIIIKGQIVVPKPVEKTVKVEID